MICPSSHPVAKRWREGDNCHIAPGIQPAPSIQERLNHFETISLIKCIICNEYLIRRYSFAQKPALLSFDFSDAVNLDGSINVDNIPCLNPQVEIKVQGKTINFRICGIIYYGESHFISRVVASGGIVWVHDGMTMGSRPEYEGELLSLGDLRKCQSKTATAAIYVPI
ncbi:hypothetical protein BD779DRAFT_1450804 [Infundibulicybe gibba]|nr:hypothetical protein BD779DRAFT_1450804 [Infundibulicybe gibba]